MRLTSVQNVSTLSDEEWDPTKPYKQVEVPLVLLGGLYGIASAYPDPVDPDFTYIDLVGGTGHRIAMTLDALLAKLNCTSPIYKE